MYQPRFLLSEPALQKQLQLCTTCRSWSESSDRRRESSRLKTVHNCFTPGAVNDHDLDSVHGYRREEELPAPAVQLWSEGPGVAVDHSAVRVRSSFASGGTHATIAPRSQSRSG